MKLISNYKDYYDHYCKNRTYSDQTYLWIRKMEEIDLKFAIPSFHYFNNEKISRIYVAPTFEAISFIVWICGNMYPVLMVTKFLGMKYEVNFYYRFDDIPEEITNSENLKYSWHKLLNKETQLKKHFSLRDTPWERLNLSNEKYPKIPLIEIHKILNTPIFCNFHPDKTKVKRYEKFNKNIITNPDLSKINFWKCLDPFVIFQQCDRFLSNELAPKDVRLDKPISDKLKAETHGFDKFSFRKDPIKKRR